MSGQSNTPVYFKKLALENIRCFSERQELILVDKDDRPARWTLIVGDNGVGKTTLLQCLARMRPVFNERPDEDFGPEPNPIEPKLASEDDNDAIIALVRSTDNIEARLEAQLSFGISLSNSERPNGNDIFTSLSIKRTGDSFTEFHPGGEFEGSERKPDRDPLVLAYGAGRHPKYTDRHFKGAFGSSNRNADSGASLFSVETPLCDAEDLLFRLEYHSMKNNPNATKLLSILKTLLAEILPDVESPDHIKILGPPSKITSFGETGIKVTTSYGTVSIRQLSFGYQTMVAWTVDIALKLLEHFPDSQNPLLEPAIVIVDEIDLHLHPRWQREIREHLTSNFPNIQFIVTAHSPLLAQSSLGANLAVLKRFADHVQILNDPFVNTDWRLDQVITSDLFGFPSSRPLHIERILDRRRKLSEKERLSDSETKELRDLNEAVSDLPTANSPEDQEAMDIIRRVANALSQKEGLLESDTQKSMRTTNITNWSD